MPYFDAKLIETPRYAELYEEATLLVVEALKAIGRPWWFTEGTLIWQLRYGRNFPTDIVDIVDDDIDVMVEAESHTEWLDLYGDLSSELTKRGWGHVVRAQTDLRTEARWDKIRALLIRPGGYKVHVDIHSYFRDPEGGVCHCHPRPDAYPFQHWSGAMPDDLVYPLATGMCYGEQTPAPNDPVRILEGWNDGEYSGSPIALPKRPCSDSELAVLEQYARDLNDAGHRSMMGFWDDLNGQSPTKQIIY